MNSIQVQGNRNLMICGPEMLSFDDKDNLANVIITFDQAPKLLGILQPKSLCSLVCPTDLPEDLLNSKHFWREAYAAMGEQAMVGFQVKPEVDLGQMMPLLKMNGFTEIQIMESVDQMDETPRKKVVALKPEFKKGGTLLKGKKRKEVPIEVEQKPVAQENCTKGCCPTPQPCPDDNKTVNAQPPQPVAEASPWDNLDEDKPAQMLNEDQLMTEADKDGSITKTFAGCGDKIMAGKPCENCTCGKAELLDNADGINKLETGQVESSCGKCYLGDAFRCASCPFLGKPAFEAGDKLKLQNADVAQVKTETEKVAIKEGGSTRVVLDL